MNHQIWYDRLQSTLWLQFGHRIMVLQCFETQSFALSSQVEGLPGNHKSRSSWMRVKLKKKPSTEDLYVCESRQMRRCSALRTPWMKMQIWNLRSGLVCLLSSLLLLPCLVEISLKTSRAIEWASMQLQKWRQQGSCFTRRGNNEPLLGSTQDEPCAQSNWLKTLNSLEISIVQLGILFSSMVNETTPRFLESSVEKMLILIPFQTGQFHQARRLRIGGKHPG